MIEVQITDEMHRLAWAKSRDMGKLKKSITAGDGNMAGFLGECVAQFILGGDLTNTLDYDIILPDGRTVDVKTKRSTSEPLPHYDCSVAAYNTVQKCDLYAFVRIEYIKNEWGRAWFLGVIPKDEYFQKSRKLYKGQRDGDNWFTVKADCYNLRIDELYSSIDNISNKE